MLERATDAHELPADVAARLSGAFERGCGDGLLQLGACELTTALPPELAFFRDFAARYVTGVCALPGLSGLDSSYPAVPFIPELAREAVFAAPLIAGSEYLDEKALSLLWEELDAALRARVAERGVSVERYLHEADRVWNGVGRVYFNLAPNRSGGADLPFAFAATYTPKVSSQGKVQHVQLRQALQEYAGANRNEQLLALLAPVQRAAEACAWVRAMVASGELYQALAWTPAEAMQLLRDTAVLEGTGVIVRLHGLWAGARPPRPQVTAVVGDRQPSGLGANALLDFKVGVTLEGEELTEEEVRGLLAGEDGLVLLRGRWIEIDRQRMGELLQKFERIEKLASRQGIGFIEASRLLAGAAIGGRDEEDAAAGQRLQWAGVIAGAWLAEQLGELQAVGGGERGRAPLAAGAWGLQATLRGYQETGVAWLRVLGRLGLGACLADDMGLGKTIQVITLLLARKKEARPLAGASLLVVPASLIANWAAELQRFAPSLSVLIAHPSEMPAESVKALTEDDLAARDVVITSYGTLVRVKVLTDYRWDAAVADEAQAIKNPATRQAKAVKSLKSTLRIALTGTPVENRLGDLWSVFDFINPGLLGSAREFTQFTRRMAEQPGNAYGPLRSLVRPYILRRMKTDRSVISDLPDKVEQTAYCYLSKRQTVLYRQAVDDLQTKLAGADKNARRGAILASLLRFKQVCNHPSHWLGEPQWNAADSGKLSRLREIAETVAEKQEKMLVFTQFQEAVGPLAGFLGRVFGRPALALHGATAVRQRKDLVQRFNDDERMGAFVLSLKAGGVGLNLTGANHVVHFDRWWNPAVENQATDRAFRIGQKRKVLVNKFVCKGTVEERIDAMINDKKKLAADILEGTGEPAITELSDKELLDLVRLDIRAASAELD